MCFRQVVWDVNIMILVRFSLLQKMKHPNSKGAIRATQKFKFSSRARSVSNNIFTAIGVPRLAWHAGEFSLIRDKLTCPFRYVRLNWKAMAGQRWSESLSPSFHLASTSGLAGGFKLCDSYSRTLDYFGCFKRKFATFLNVPLIRL